MPPVDCGRLCITSDALFCILQGIRVLYCARRPAKGGSPIRHREECVMLQLTVSLRAIVFVLLLGAITFTGSDVARGAPSVADLNQDGNIIFSGPGVDGARDIRTTNNDGGLRFYNGNGPLTNPPDGAAIQFFGNDRGTFNGQAFIDSGAHANAAIIFRTG